MHLMSLCKYNILANSSFSWWAALLNDNDDRVVIVEVTEKGRKMKEEIIEVPEKMYCKFGKSIEDLVELKRLLDNLLATFK